VQLRRPQPRDAQTLDDLFGVNFDDAEGLKKLPADAVASVQRLALWLPADGRLLWQLGELARAAGDVTTAAAILDGCVTEFGLSDPGLRRRRQQLRAEADALARQAPAAGGGAKLAHEGHAGAAGFKSPRPLARREDSTKLPPIRPDGVNPMPWPLLTQTALDRQFRPTFPKHLRDLDARQVTLTGYMQPIGDELDMNAFLLIEYPVGCWFCETPEATGIVLVELPPGKTVTLSRAPVKVEGVLSLNGTDPENFLFTVKSAKAGAAD